MSQVKCWLVDAFTETVFSGNPAAVCWLEEDVPDEWMQAVAAEMNFSETAFVQRQEGRYRLRWFTPQVEVPLCGHATLASAHALWEAGLQSYAEPVKFHTRSGVLVCQRRGGFIDMDFPAIPSQELAPPPDLLAALGASAAYIGKSQFDHLVVLEDPETLRSLAPDFRKLKEFPTRGVIVTAHSDDPRYDFLSRFFAPAVGIDEDPVTGSAHCCLAPYWADVLGRTAMTGFQASARGGVVRVRLDGDRVFLGGQAVTVLQGELLAGC